MNYIEIKTKECFASPTNPRGDFMKDQAFKDLMSSIKEKGVITPIIVRKVKNKYEVVAGNRRFAAASELKLETIPAQVMELDDTQASEVQIIENLQRSDIHPINEGESFKRLITEHKLDVKTISIRIGKTESYVRYRLFLTNLIFKMQKLFRSGKITDKHAQIIGKLGVDDQEKIYEYVNDRWDAPSPDDLKDYIKRHIYDVLSNQPWIGNKELMEVVGPCVECNHANLDLFGQSNKEACNNTVCWERKMKKYLEYMMNKHEIKVKVSDEYGSTNAKDVLSKSDYETLSTNKKKHCEFADKALVTEGEKLGNILYICRDSKCPIHGTKHTDYALTPEEKKKRKEDNAKALEKQRKEDQKYNQSIIDAFDLYGEGLTKEATLTMVNYLIDSLRELDEVKPICTRFELEPIIEEQKGWDDNKVRKVKAWAKTLKAYAKTLDENKLFSLFLHVAIGKMWQDKVKALIKDLKIN